MDGMTYDKPCQNCKRICMEFNARFLSPKAYEEWSVRMDNCIEKAEEERSAKGKRQQELEQQRITAMQKRKGKAVFPQVPQKNKKANRQYP